jgi:exonuclease SbcC
MFSGGEAFRINLALRVALSRMLAHRAGAPLQTLILDEGFGTQDPRGREAISDSLTAIADDFALVLVITHVEELKDAFPTRIEVTKNAEGSRFFVV